MSAEAGTAHGTTTPYENPPNREPNYLVSSTEVSSEPRYYVPYRGAVYSVYSMVYSYIGIYSIRIESNRIHASLFGSIPRTVRGVRVLMPFLNMHAYSNITSPTQRPTLNPQHINKRAQARTSLQHKPTQAW